MKAINQILKEEREESNLNAWRLKAAYNYKNQYLIDSKGSLFLTVDSLIQLNNIITGSNLRIYHVRPAGYRSKKYMTTDKIEASLYGLIDDFNDRRILHRFFCQTFLDQIHSFADGNGRACKILFATLYL